MVALTLVVIDAFWRKPRTDQPQERTKHWIVASNFWMAGTSRTEMQHGMATWPIQPMIGSLIALCGCRTAGLWKECPIHRSSNPKGTSRLGRSLALPPVAN